MHHPAHPTRAHVLTRLRTPPINTQVLDVELSAALFRHSTEITGAQWPKENQVVSPCPTLKVVGAVSKAMIAREELKRMKEHPGFDEDGNPIVKKVTTKQKAALVADKVSPTRPRADPPPETHKSQTLGLRPQPKVHLQPRRNNDLTPNLTKQPLGDCPGYPRQHGRARG